MSHIFNDEINFKDSSDKDAFGRLRTSQAVSLFNSQLQYDKGLLEWDEILVGTGSTLHVPTLSAVKLSVGTALGDSVIRQTRRYFRYQPGASQSIFMTGNLGIKKIGVVQRIGYYDDNNGLFFQVDETNISVVVRSNTTGVPIDTTVSQSNWNLDKLDGTGISGITLDTSKDLIYVIDFQWLGAGRVRFGINIAGQTIYCHESLHSNLLIDPYMTTANLPLRYELKNIAITASLTDMHQFANTVISEGGVSVFDEEGVVFSKSTDFLSKAFVIGIMTPIISIRIAPLKNGIINRGTIFPVSIDILTNQQGHVELIRNPILTTPIWTPVGIESGVEFDISAITTTGGIDIGEFYVDKKANLAATHFIGKFPLTLDALGITSDILTLAIGGLANPGLAYGSITWKEIY